MTAWKQLIEEAFDAWEGGNAHDALQRCDRAALMGPEARYAAAMLRGDILLGLGDAAGALSSFETVADVAVRDPDVDCARGRALFALGRLAEAENALRSALREKDDLAEAHYTLGLIVEHRATGEEVVCFRRARLLDPLRYGGVRHLADAAFAEMVENVTTALVKRIQDALGRGPTRPIPVVIAELPHPEDIGSGENKVPPSTLGIVVGHANSGGISQPAVMLFKRNLERGVRSEEELEALVEHTLVQQIARLLGLGEADLRTCGLL